MQSNIVCACSALILTLAGCATAHAPCEGAPVEGYTLELVPVSDAADGCLGALTLDVSEDRLSLCEITDAVQDTCGSVLTAQCNIPYSGPDDYVSFELELELTWAGGGATGTGRATLLGADGSALCTTEYAVTRTPRR